jgi:hypothetical protein
MGKALDPSKKIILKVSYDRKTLDDSTYLQGCQMVLFHTKNPNFGKFCRALEWKMLLDFMTI